jgi:hypothetical protein
LSPPRFGDAIFLFGHPEDSGSAASLDQLRELVLKNGLRFYGMSFTDPLEGKLPPGFDLNQRLPAGVGPPKLTELNLATGYFFSFHSVKVLAMPAMTVSIRGKVRYIPAQLSLLKTFLADLYAGIAAPYRVGIPASAIQAPEELKIAVTNADDRQIRERDVHYPHLVYPCSAQAPMAR